MPGKKGPAASIIIKALLLSAALLGQAVSLRHVGFMTGAHYLYYTNLSNIWTLLLALSLLIIELYTLSRGKAARLPAWLHKLRFALTVGVLLTFVVFSLLLAPMMAGTGYLLSLPNLLVHNLVPLLAGLDFVLFDHGAPRKPSLLWGLMMPSLYVAFALLLARFGAFFGQGSRFPYFFLDYEKNGWFSLGGGRLGVVWWILLLSGLLLLMGKALLALQRRAAKRTNK